MEIIGLFFGWLMCGVTVVSTLEDLNDLQAANKWFRILFTVPFAVSTVILTAMIWERLS